MAMANHACPYVVSRQPVRRRRGEKKNHVAQVSEAQITRAFREAAAACGIEGVTFHEVRALSAYLYGKRHDRQQVQQLMAHTDEAMTAHYQAGHAVEWRDITISLEL